MFNEGTDVTYGSIYCVCYLIGMLGNTVSFFYFKSKKRDISNVIYMLITANDIVVCITSLPVGISFMSKRQPGIIFGNKYVCDTWYYTWEIAILLSAFLVLCLSAARTLSLINPFMKQKIKYLAIAVPLFVAVMFAIIRILHSLDDADVLFLNIISRCSLFVYGYTPKKSSLFSISISYCAVYTTPALAVAVSCIISWVVLTRRNKNVQQRELQQSRNRATVTILLFALLFEICFTPLVVHYMMRAFCVLKDDLLICMKAYKFDTQFYYRNVIYSLLPAVNSATNPIFYFWRMAPLRKYFLTDIWGIMMMNRNARMNTTNNAQQTNATSN